MLCAVEGIAAELEASIQRANSTPSKVVLTEHATQAMQEQEHTVWSVRVHGY